MEVELQATYTALGFQEGNDYHREPDCVETVKDLIRFLKREDEKCGIRRQLGSAQIVQKDLVPLLRHYSHETELMEVVIRLLVNLTQPAVLCFRNDLPTDKINRNYFLEVESHLQCYKEAFVDESLFAVFAQKLGALLQLDWENRQEEDRLLIERILILLRNILHIPPDEKQEQRTDDDASIHDQVLWALHISGMEDLLLYLASSENERQYSLHVLEIISHMLREQTAEQLASAGMSRSLSEREKEARDLALMVEKERETRKAQLRRLSTRHSRFGGTFLVANMKSISSHSLIYHRSLAGADQIAFDYAKRARKKARGHRPMTGDDRATRRSTLSIRLFLREFCAQFLDGSYNPLMYSVKDALLRARTQENDETYYLWSMTFFMEFNRRCRSPVALVSETMSVPMFHYVHTNMQNYHDMVLSDKKEAVVWSRRLHIAVKAYRELLETLNAMDKSCDQQLKASAKVMKGNVFYTIEYRDMFLTLLQRFDETKQSRSFLADLIESTHLYLKMLEVQCSKNVHLVVQAKTKRKRKKKRRVVSAAAPPGAMTGDQLEELWDTVSGELSAIFQGRGEVATDVTPFDAASELEVDEQRVAAMRQIQNGLRRNQPGTAVGVFRAAREVWPDGGEFGRADISPEDEFMALREVFFTDLPRPEGEERGGEEDRGGHEGEDEEQEEEEEEEEERELEYSEAEFNFKDYVSRFARPRVVAACVALLSGYEALSPHALHCALKLLHRIAYDCRMTGMLFQASLFRIFHKVLSVPRGKIRQYEELAVFAQHIVRQFFDVAKTNDKLFVELFFWKNSKEAVDVTDGYGTSDARSRKGRQMWTEETDDEIRQLHEQHQQTETPDVDVADYIVANLIDQSKTRRQVVRQLVRLELIGGAAELKKNKGASGKRSQLWTEEEEALLRQLYEQFKDSSCPISDILANLAVKRSKQKVIEKLMALDLISERREVMRKAGSRRWRKRDGAEEEEEGGREGREDEGREDEREERTGGQDSAGSDPSSDSDDGDSRPAAPSSESSESEGDEPSYVQKIRKAAKTAIDDGMADAVLWIQGCLNRTADDREDEGDNEPIPVVPLTDDQMDAMDHAAFGRLLRSLGVNPPASEQEQFWRIGGDLSANELRSRAAALRSSDSAAEESALKKKKSGKFSALVDLAKRRASRKTRKRRRKESKTSDLEDPPPPPAATLERGDPPAEVATEVCEPTRPRAKRMLGSDSAEDSDDENNDDRLVIDTESRQVALPAKRAKVIVSDDDDSDADSSPHAEVGDALPPDLDDSDDSDVGDDVPIRRAVRRVTTIESDSDE